MAHLEAAMLLSGCVCTFRRVSLCMAGSIKQPASEGCDHRIIKGVMHKRSTQGRVGFASCRDRSKSLLIQHKQVVYSTRGDAAKRLFLHVFCKCFLLRGPAGVCFESHQPMV